MGASGAAAQRVEGEGVSALVAAASGAGVRQFVLVSQLGGGGPLGGLLAGLGAGGGGPPKWKRRAEEALQASGMNFAIVRPGALGGACCDGFR